MHFKRKTQQPLSPLVSILGHIWLCCIQFLFWQLPSRQSLNYWFLPSVAFIFCASCLCSISEASSNASVFTHRGHWVPNSRSELWQDSHSNMQPFRQMIRKKAAAESWHSVRSLTNSPSAFPVCVSICGCEQDLLTAWQAELLWWVHRLW